MFIKDFVCICAGSVIASSSVNDDPFPVPDPDEKNVFEKGF